ncbi:uncharacterized protein LOC104654389 [Rhinopithecus roxellana]|uniref:uncharacterized protein LOC104654389 n=1 Tax=Rhinopithecus roxellana TaxID=61622 RepID=UPI0012376AD4|nr:uncharacterized protein LOC104654389 [Rhinopithecus roxellana]
MSFPSTPQQGAFTPSYHHCLPEAVNLGPAGPVNLHNHTVRGSAKKGIYSAAEHCNGNATANYVHIRGGKGRKEEKGFQRESSSEDARVPGFLEDKFSAADQTLGRQCICQENTRDSVENTEPGG